MMAAYSLVLKVPLNTNQPQNEVQYFRTKNLGAANLANPFNKRNIEDQRLNNKLTYFYQLLLFLSQYLDVLFNSVIIRKPGTMVTHMVQYWENIVSPILANTS